MHTAIIIVHVLCTLFLILVILLQSGKGAAMGSGLGAGSRLPFLVKPRPQKTER